MGPGCPSWPPAPKPGHHRRVGPKLVPETSSSAPWLTLRGWLHGPEDLFDPPPPRDPVSQPELWDGGG